MREWRREAGQTAAEYVGVLLVVSVIIAAVAATDIGTRIGCHARALVQKTAGVGRVKITLDRSRRLVLKIEGEAPSYGVALYEDHAMLGGTSPVANYTEAAVDILHAYAPEHEGAFHALPAAARP